MRILILEWGGYMETDLEYCLEKLGIDILPYGYCIDSPQNDPYFTTMFRSILLDEHPDAVMMMNYMAPIAILCAEYDIPFISWIYDCPFRITSTQYTMGLPTTHVFLFDRAEAARYQSEFGDHIHHLPLAVNTERFDELVRIPDQLYSSEVSFVGQLYESHYPLFRTLIPDYLKGYCDSLLSIQALIYGTNILNESLNQIITEDVLELFSDIEGIKGASLSLFKEWVEETISREITHRERLSLLKSISDTHETSLYSPSGVDFLPRIKYRGTVSGYDVVPLIYHQTKINLNISLRCITSGIPLRALEILGSGGFLLSNWQPEIAEFFEDGKEVVLYTDIEDALNKVDYYLSHEDERIQIAEAGRKAVEQFSFENQVTQILHSVFPDYPR